ncbi:hypothetical protein LJC44_06580 [Parabacteroides sp. OttesenSCG-928-G06]|nr:hypothetical protein [Parabacteroides sp. OttesenSCG-928-K15]MDL2282748.1 hypothetical protein [Parabacteroides sp. OttesenSCG-928-G06]
MRKNTSVALGDYFESFVEEENHTIALKVAIQEGVDSGIATDFNPEKHLQSLKELSLTPLT